jgi:pyridoxine 5-phosphate synthase
MTRLSVNVNKIATLRNARGGNTPDLIQVCKDIERFGAQGITVHPRPDERHIKRKDVNAIKDEIKVEFNIEGYPSKDFIEMVIGIKPEQVTLVPDSPEVLTSNAGWNTVKHLSFLKEITHELKLNGIRSSIFIETDPIIIEKAKEAGADRVELYTESYAANYSINKEAAIAEFIEAAKVAHKVDLGLNAGHDLNLVNLKYFHENIPHLLEVSIGHALISDALYFGLENTIQLYLRCLK